MYFKVTDMFSEPQKNKNFQHLTKDADVQIEAIQLFKNDVKPWWEDAANQKAGEVRFEVSYDFKDIFNKLYQDLVLDIVGQMNEGSRHVIYYHKYLDQWSQSVG